jgi:hypothetical protein
MQNNSRTRTHEDPPSTRRRGMRGLCSLALVFFVFFSFANSRSTASGPPALQA